MGDNAVREMGRMVLLALLVALPARAETEWLPLPQALLGAKSSGRLILLYLRSESRGVRQTDEWIAHADSNEGLKGVLADFALAQETPAVAGAMLPDLASLRKGRAQHLVVLDPGGTLLFEPGFLEYTELAARLAQIRQQAPVFAASVRARDEGRSTESLLLRANGLLYAGAKPADYYDRIIALATAEKNELLVQDAEIGLATIASRKNRRNDAKELLRKVANAPAHPQLGARAWILLGHELRDDDDRRGAIAAYQKAYRLTPPPSVYGVAARRFLEMMGSAPEGEVQSAVAAGAVRLLYPHRAVLAGDVEVTAAAPPSAARVDFFLDDARVAERTRPPFVAKIALGALPRVHTIKAVAFDAADARLGEDAATINERAEALGVEIVAPRDSSVESSTVVEVRPRVPQGDRIESIDLFWNEQKLTTLAAPPFRYELTLPSRRAFGYIRAVARDANGATAEDAKLINSEGSAAEVRVDAVELHAIVQDRNGHNVEGLTAKDFAVKEDGAPVDVAVHNDANEPITVGLAVDASASMRNAMASVMEDAAEFLRHSLSRGDQTFVVSFAESPLLYQPLTADLAHVSASIFDMRAVGNTALWDAIIFSLDQLRGVAGKRALLVFTDGVDNGSRATQDAALAYAHETGVPIYIVLIYTGAAPVMNVTGDFGSVQTVSGALFAAPLRKLADESGGALIRFPRQQDLPKLFQQVRDDTRGAYALTFVSRSAKTRRAPRKLSVAVVGRRDVVVRAPSAYLPR